MIDALKRDISANVAGAKKRSVNVESIRSTLQSCFAVYDEMKEKTDKVDRTVMNSLLNAWRAADGGWNYSRGLRKGERVTR